MKIIKARIHKVVKPAAGKGRMGYPAGYDNDDVVGQGMGPGSFQRSGGAYSGGIGRGADEEWCLFLIPDALADQYATDPDMEIVNAATADALMEQWRIDNNESETVVRDADRISLIYTKQGASLALTADEEKMLDPDDEMPGINKRLRSVAAIVADTGKALTSKEIE